MEFIVKKTHELTSEEKLGIITLFNRVFDKQRTVKEFDDTFLNTSLGYSIHSYMVVDGEVVGSNSYIPSNYCYNGKVYTFVNSVDSMIDKPHRDFINLYDIVNNASSYMKKDGISFVLGFPNDNAFPVIIKSKLSSHIGELRTFMLPMSFAVASKKLKPFDCIMRFAACCFITLSKIRKKRKFISTVHKDEKTFDQYRYKWFGGDYNITDYKGSHFVYKISEYSGFRTAFLVDVADKSSKNFINAVSYIRKNHKKEIDLILYVGTDNLKNIGLIKVPTRFEPKKFHFTGRILDKKLIGKDIFDMSKWDVNLSNYDLL